MVTNFDYLKAEPKFSRFADVAISAEKIILMDPEASIINSRRAMEFAIKWMYSVDSELEMPYQDNFENVGFTNVTTNVEYDIVTGWLTDDGEVKSVTINGKKEFDSDDKYRLDAEVVVTYHTLKKNKPK